MNWNRKHLEELEGCIIVQDFDCVSEHQEFFCGILEPFEDVVVARAKVMHVAFDRPSSCSKAPQLGAQVPRSRHMCRITKVYIMVHAIH